MDTSYFAYDWNKVILDNEKKIEKPYIIVNLNKNAEQFFDELVQDIKHYSEKGYRIYYVPVAH
jgi:UDP-2,3-diacylglucosamine pyrophosphatase LpxH